MIDQCRSYGYGINADIALAEGKVVLSGATEEALSALKVKNCPVFNIEPDNDQIYATLKYIMEHRDRIPEWGKKSREYVEQFHDAKAVAQRYVETWRAFGLQ